MSFETLPEVGQIGIAVEDLDKALAYFSEKFNITKWNRVDYTPETATWNGKKALFKFKLAFADTKNLNLELIQVVSGEIQHSEFLRKTGGGVHHLGFYVKNVDQWIEHFRKKDIPVIMDLEGIVGSRGRRRAVFFDTSASGVLFEFIQII